MQCLRRIEIHNKLETAYKLYQQIQKMSHIEKQQTFKQLYNMRPNNLNRQKEYNEQSKSRSRSKSASRIFKYKQQQQQMKSKISQNLARNSAYSPNYRHQRNSPVLEAKSALSDYNPKSRVSFISSNSNLTYADRLALPRIQTPPFVSAVNTNQQPMQNVIINGKQIRPMSVQKVPITFHYGTPTQNFHPNISVTYSGPRQIRFNSESATNSTALTPPKFVQLNQAKAPFQLINNIPQQIMRSCIDSSAYTKKQDMKIRDASNDQNIKNINQIKKNPSPHPVKLQYNDLYQKQRTTLNLNRNSNSRIEAKSQKSQNVYYPWPEKQQNVMQPSKIFAQTNKSQFYHNPEHRNITNYVTIHEPVILKQVHEIHHIRDAVPIHIPALPQQQPALIQLDNARKTASYIQSKPLISSQSILQPLKQDFTRYMNTTAGRQSQFNQFNYNDQKNREQIKSTIMRNSRLSSKPNIDVMEDNTRNNKSRISALDIPIEMEVKKSQIRIQQDYVNTNNRYFDASVKIQPIKRIDTLTANVRQLTSKKVQQQPKYETWSMQTPYEDNEQKDSPLLIKKERPLAFAPPPLKIDDKNLMEINELSISQIDPVLQKSQSGIDVEQSIPTPLKQNRSWTYLDLFVIFLLIGIGITLLLYQIFR